MNNQNEVKHLEKEITQQANEIKQLDYILIALIVGCIVLSLI